MSRLAAFISLLVLVTFAGFPTSLPAQASAAPLAGQNAGTAGAPGVGQSVINTLKEGPVSVPWSLSFAKLFWTVVILAAAALLLRFASKILELLAERWATARLAIKRTIPIIRVLGWTIAIYFVLVSVLAPSVQTLVAVAASAGIAIGLASQDLVKNIIGGILILFDRPFRVGDKIKVGSFYGEVTRIGLRTVRVVTPEDSMVSIPNSEIMTSSVANSNSGEFNCQVVADFFLSPTVDIVQVKAVLRSVAAVSRYAYLRKPIVVLVDHEFRERRPTLHVRLKAYVFDLRFEFPFASDMTEVALRELGRRGLLESSPRSLGDREERSGGA